MQSPTFLRAKSKCPFWLVLGVSRHYFGEVNIFYKPPPPLCLSKFSQKSLEVSETYRIFAAMNRKKRRKDKFANWLLDIAKYITTAVIISSIFEGIENRVYLLIAGIAVVGASLGWGLFLIQDDDPKNKKKG